MQHFRTKPQVVQAVQIASLNNTELYSILSKIATVPGIVNLDVHGKSDWIVKHPEGKIEVITKEDFTNTYESISNSI